jgi:hypothetical protein
VKRPSSKLRDFLIAVVLLGTLIALVSWHDNKFCNGRCPQDHKCADMCFSRHYCPASQE